MMTTGYDCPDLLNICMARPMFSPSDFVQFKGRGTKSTKITLEQEFEIIQKRYKPKIDDWIELLKKHFPFTYKDKIK